MGCRDRWVYIGWAGGRLSLDPLYYHHSLLVPFSTPFLYLVVLFGECSLLVLSHIPERIWHGKYRDEDEARAVR